MTKQRLEWISGAKFIAIMAVVIVHCNGLMYTSNYIAMATSFSVTLFILLSGIGTYFSYSKSLNTSIVKGVLKTLPLLKSYILATFILYLAYKREFLLLDLLKHIVKFDIEGTFYFVFFFLQLKLISPILLKWYGYCDRKPNRAMLHGLSLAASLVLSSIFINHTYTLPLYGGGKFLFGGTYFFVYYLGIVIGSICNIKPEKKQLILIGIVSAVLWFIWSVGIATYKLPFDIWLRPVLGYGDNPPSLNYIVFALLTLTICYAFIELLSGIDNTVVKKLLSVITCLGNNTLEIFLYHFAIMKLATEFFPVFTLNVWLARLVLFPAMVLLAPAVKYVFLKIIKCNDRYSKSKITLTIE